MKIFRRLSSGLPLAGQFVLVFAFTFTAGLAVLILFARETADNKAALATTAKTLSAAEEQVVPDTEDAEKSNPIEWNQQTQSPTDLSQTSSQGANRRNGMMSETDQQLAQGPAQRSDIAVTPALSTANSAEQGATYWNRATLGGSPAFLADQPASTGAIQNSSSASDNSANSGANGSKATYPLGQRPLPLGDPFTLEEEWYRSMYGWSAFAALHAQQTVVAQQSR